MKRWKKSIGEKNKNLRFRMEEVKGRRWRMRRREGGGREKSKRRKG